MPANPVLTAVDLSHCSACDIDGLTIDAGSYDVQAISAQTTTTSVGLKTPNNNNGGTARLGSVGVIGFYTAMTVNEHTHGETVFINGCMQALNFLFANHSSWFGRVVIQHCKKALVFTGGIHTTSIDVLNVEHAASGTWVETNDVDDASNYARGSLRWYSILANSGPSDAFTVSGGAYLKRQHLTNLGKVYTLSDGATVTVNCNLAESFRWTLGGNRTFANPIAPWDGMVINVRVIQDGAGSRTWTLGSKFKFPGGAPALSTAINAKDFISCQYDAADDTWNCAISKGMA